MANIAEQLSELNRMSQKSVALFHQFALSIGVSDSALGVMYALVVSDIPCSQYDLCNNWCIPKQTINSAVASLQKKGYLSLSHISGARNKKSIVLTDKGREFAEKTVGKLRSAELSALAELSDEERALYVRLNCKYNEFLNAKLNGFSEN